MVENSERPSPVIIGVAGGSGSGKTTVSREIFRRVGGTDRIAYMEHDSYYKDVRDLPQGVAQTLNFDHPDSLETPLMIDHIKRLKRWEAVDVPIYDFKTYFRSVEVRRLEPQPVILVEGILVFAEPELRALFDMKIFVDTEADIRFIRRLRRDTAERGRTMDSVIEQYLQSVRPMHRDFVEPSKRYADVIIPEGGLNVVAIEMVAARVRTLLALHE